MKCCECEAAGLRSRVYVAASIRTAVGWRSYYDEDGNFVDNDPNVTATSYVCTNGHKWKAFDGPFSS
jgi:hypothetical protein